MLRVGMVGLGNMGSGIALNIVKAGYSLCMYDAAEGRTKHLQEKWISQGDLAAGPGVRTTPGLSSAASPADVMLCSDLCLMCVFTEAQGEATIIGDEGFLSAGRLAMDGKLIVDHGTVSPLYSKRMADAVSCLGGGYLDAPVSGGPGGAQNGTLSVMVGGNREHLDACMPVLETISSSVEYMGNSGAGSSAKLVNQHLVILNTVAACEAYVLAKKLGLEDTGRLKTLLGASWGHSLMLDKTLSDLIRAEEKGEEALNESMAPLRALAKDAKIVSKAASDAQAYLPLFPAAGAQVDKAVQRGLTECDFAAVASVIRDPEDSPSTPNVPA